MSNRQELLNALRAINALWEQVADESISHDQFVAETGTILSKTLGD